MDTPHEEDRLLAERAAEWLYRLETATLKEKAAFFRWLKESPRHVREMLIAIAWEESLREVDPNHKIDIDPPESKPKKSNVTYLTPRPTAASRRRPPAPPGADPPEQPWEERRLVTDSPPVRTPQPAPRPRLWHPPLVTLLRVPALFLFALLLSVQPSDYVIETGPGQWQTRTLNDGSVVRVGPRTKMIVEFEDDQRLVHLKDGEATFNVAKDAHRPFIVDTDRAAARAVGTRFSVTRLKHQTEVVIAQGIVAVSTLGPVRPGHLPQSAQVSGGLQVIIDKTATLETRQVNVDEELAWEHGIIVFKRVPLAQAIEQFNRRNLMQIPLPKQARAKSYRITGTFRLDQPEAFSSYLKDQLDRRTTHTRECEATPPQLLDEGTCLSSG